MDAKTKVKEMLFEDKDKLIWLLEQLGCHKISLNLCRNEIRCALPDAENPTSVSILIEKYLPCQIFSRAGYEDYEIKDIYALVQFVKNVSFPKAVEWCCEKLGVENDGNYEVSETLGIVQELRREKRKQNRSQTEIYHEPLDKKILRNYKPIVVPKWVEEGISPETQKKYGIVDDTVGKRWLIPIYDESNNLISLKGRTYAPNWEVMGIMKFIYYHKLGTNDILFGLNYNKQSIIEHDEIILYEAEKSVMASDSYGYDWASSLGKNGINPHLLKKILALKVSNCVLAFDNDVPYKTALKEAKKLSKYMNVYLMLSKGRLEGKQSPTDAGKEVFEEIYNTRVRVR